MATSGKYGVPPSLEEELSPQYREHLKKAGSEGLIAGEDFTGNFKLIHETEKAVLLQPTFGINEPEAWVPRSSLLNIADTDTLSCGFCVYEITMKRWIAKTRWSVQ